MMEKPIRKQFKFTKVGIVIFDPNCGQVIPYKSLTLKGHLKNEEITKEIKKLNIPNIGVSDFIHFTKYYEISESDFIKHAKQITEQESKYYYVKKGDK